MDPDHLVIPNSNFAEGKSQILFLTWTPVLLMTVVLICKLHRTPPMPGRNSIDNPDTCLGTCTHTNRSISLSCKSRVEGLLTGLLAQIGCTIFAGLHSVAPACQPRLGGHINMYCIWIQRILNAHKSKSKPALLQHAGVFQCIKTSGSLLRSFCIVCKLISSLSLFSTAARCINSWLSAS